MCGIAGFIDYNQSSAKEILKSCTDVLGHRGPDGNGYLYFEKQDIQIGLGHRRLSIIDLSHAAAQPMQYQDLHIVFNGEIYNYAEIKVQLEKAGHKFLTHSDTEVILHAFQAWGPSMVDRFIGMFAIVIYQESTGLLYGFRDRAGVKPFYYYWANGLFLFASELKSFHEHPGFIKKINQGALQQYFQYGYILAPQSIFQNTWKLKPGHFLKFDLQSQTLEEQPYWDVLNAYRQPKIHLPENEIISETEKLLRSACSYRMVSDVPVGVFLSGGYDSTAVTALLQTERTEKIKTFTIGFHEEDHNEAVYAKKVATHLGTDHTEYYCTTREAQEIIPQIPFFCDEPFGDSSIIPTTLVSRLARQSVTVALSADAGDEVFAGYPKYPLSIEFAQKINRIPHPLKGMVSKILQYTPESLLVTISGNSAAAIKKERFVRLLKKSNLSANLIMDELMSQVYSDKQVATLLQNPVTRPWSSFDELSELPASLGVLDSLLAIDYKTYMVDDILTKVDRAGMSVSLEGREPLLDHRLIEWAARLPESFKLRNGISKFVLREIVHQYVPKEIMERPKMGFGVPVFSWLRGDLRYYADEYLQPKHFEVHNLLKPEAVQHIKDRFFAGDRNYNSLFWYLLMFQMWYKRWME